MDIELGDAFLRFLMVCEYADALELTQSEVSSVVGRMWGEFKVAASSDAVAYLEDPSNGGPTMARGLAVLAKNAVRPARPLTIAFIYDDDEQYSGWVAEHDRGRRELELRMPGVVRTLAFPECESNAAFAAAVEEAASEDADLVVTVQPTQMTQTLRAAIEHPEMSFLNCSLSLEHSAVRTFGCRVYEAKFLLGLVAGSMAENHQVGYIAESPVYGTVSEINAFAAGVAAVDPGAEIHLGWISTCDYNWRADMSAAGVSVVCGRDTKTPTDPFGAWGLFRYEADGSTTQLGHPVWNWARYYELIVRSMRNDVWRREGLENPDQALNYWWGMSTGVLDVELTDAVPAGVAVVMGVMREAIMKQKLNPFALVPADMAGEIETPERISPEEIIRMSWLADNVIGRLPRERELKPDSREQVEVAGIISVEIGIEEEPGSRRRRLRMWMALLSRGLSARPHPQHLLLNLPLLPPLLLSLLLPKTVPPQKFLPKRGRTHEDPRSVRCRGVLVLAHVRPSTLRGRRPYHLLRRPLRGLSRVHCRYGEQARGVRGG